MVSIKSENSFSFGPQVLRVRHVHLQVCVKTETKLKTTTKEHRSEIRSFTFCDKYKLEQAGNCTQNEESSRVFFDTRMEDPKW